MTVAAWRALATPPIQYMRRMRRYPLLFGMVSYCALVTSKLGLAPYHFPIMLLGGCVVLACGVIVRYFGIETTVRRLLEVISRQLPADFELEVTGLPLRWRLLVAAPIINVIAAVVVAGLTARGHHENLSDLGAAVLIAVVVSFTISLDLARPRAARVTIAAHDARRPAAGHRAPRRRGLLGAGSRRRHGRDRGPGAVLQPHGGGTQRARVAARGVRRLRRPGLANACCARAPTSRARRSR